MYIQVLQNTEEESGTTTLNSACAHQRLIDDILTKVANAQARFVVLNVALRSTTHIAVRDN